MKSFEEHRTTKVIEQLLVNGANPNILDQDGKKALDYIPSDHNMLKAIKKMFVKYEPVIGIDIRTDFFCVGLFAQGRV